MRSRIVSIPTKNKRYSTSCPPIGSLLCDYRQSRAGLITRITSTRSQPVNKLGLVTHLRNKPRAHVAARVYSHKYIAAAALRASDSRPAPLVLMKVRLHLLETTAARLCDRRRSLSGWSCGWTYTAGNRCGSDHVTGIVLFQRFNGVEREAEYAVAQFS